MNTGMHSDDGHGGLAAKSIRLEVRVWYDERTRHIKIAGQGLTASTVSNDPASKRFHPNLFRKLAAALRSAGAPAPGAEPGDERTAA